MSGPKVVRIVTREEMEARMRQLLQLFLQELEELRHCAKRHDALDEVFQARLEERRVRMARLFEGERWEGFQKQVPGEIAFLKSERERIQARAVAAVEAARSKRQRTEGAARTLLAAFEAAGRAPPEGLREVAEQAPGAGEEALGKMQRVLTEAFRQLSPAPSVGTSVAQRELAARLGAGEQGQRFTEWLEAQPGAAFREPDARLNALLAEIEALEDAEVARPFLERAAAISRQTQAGHRALMTDSLMMEVSAHRRARKEREAVAANLREVHCGLIALDTARARTLGARISASLEAQQPGELEGLLREAGEVLEAERREMAAAARRRAVLNGLAALGYEVRESMAVAWPKEGRIVMRKPGVADYGLELGAPADAARVQMRLVGSDRPVVPRHAGRDRDMETVWCADFQKLREQVALSGAEVIIERALEAGAQPVKTVPMERQERPEDTAADRVAGRRTIQ